MSAEHELMECSHRGDALFQNGALYGHDGALLGKMGHF